MKNYHGENISVVWWLSKSILQGVLAPTSIVVLALLDINYSLSENIGDGYVRAVAVLFIKLPIFVIIHIFFFVVANYFVNLPIKIIELKRLLKILGILFICYLISIGLQILSNIENFYSDPLFMLFVPFLLMIIPLTLTILCMNVVEVFWFKSKKTGHS